MKRTTIMLFGALVVLLIMNGSAIVRANWKAAIRFT